MMMIAMRASLLSLLTPPSSDTLCTQLRLWLKMFIAFSWGRVFLQRALGPNAESHSWTRTRSNVSDSAHILRSSPWHMLSTTDLGPKLWNQKHLAQGERPSPWTRLLASPAVAEDATAKIPIATHTRPIPGRAIRPEAPRPPLEVPVSAHATSPIVLVWRPPPILLPLPLLATVAPLREAQVHRAAVTANPAIPLDPFVHVLGFIRAR